MSDSRIIKTVFCEVDLKNVDTYQIFMSSFFVICSPLKY